MISPDASKKEADKTRGLRNIRSNFSRRYKVREGVKRLSIRKINRYKIGLVKAKNF